MRQPFPGRNPRLTTDMHTLTGHICNILNASAKDCSISRNQQHMCNNPSLLGSIRLYWIGTGTTVQYSGKLESQKSSYSFNTRMKQQEKYSLVTTLGHHFTKQKHSFSQLIICFSYNFLLLELNWLCLWFFYIFETKKKIQQSLLELLCLLVSTLTSCMTHMNSIINIHIEYIRLMG